MSSQRPPDGSENTLESTDVHRGSGKVAQGAGERKQHHRGFRAKRSRGHIPKNEHTPTGDKTMCQDVIDQSGLFCQNPVASAAPPPGTSYNQSHAHPGLIRH